LEVSLVILTGRKIELMPMEYGHIEEVYEAGHYPEIWALTQGRISLLEDAREYVRKALESTGALISAGHI
jgi:N-acetyltransferase